MDFYRQNLIYSAGRYEIWEAGKCLDKGMCAVTIKAISSESKIKFIIEGAEHLPLSPIVTFFYQDPNAEILRDRIQYFDINNSGQTPSICNIFPSDDGEDITYIRFAVSGNVGYRIIEFYGQVLSVGEGVVDSSLSVTSSEKIIKQLRQTHSYTSEAIMQWAVDIFNANSDLGNEDTQGAIKKTDAIVEALKLFVEALKCDMKERDYDEQGPSLMYPKYCMFIASCNYKIGNYNQAYHVATKGLESMDEIMENSVIQGFDKDFLGQKELQEIVDVIEDQNFEDIDWSIDSEDIDETEIDTTNYDELKIQLCGPSESDAKAVFENPLFTKESLKSAHSHLGDVIYTLIYDGSDDGTNVENQKYAGNELLPAKFILAAISDHIFDYYPYSYFLSEDARKDYPSFLSRFKQNPAGILDQALSAVRNNFVVLETVTRDEYNQHRIPRRKLDKEEHVIAVLEEVRNNLSIIMALLNAPKKVTDPLKPTEKEIRNLIQILDKLSSSIPFEGYESFQLQQLFEVFKNPLLMAWQKCKYGWHTDFWEEGHSMIDYMMFEVRAKDVVNELLKSLREQSIFSSFEPGDNPFITMGLEKVYSYLLEHIDAPE